MAKNEGEQLIQITKDIIHNAEVKDDHRHKGMIWVRVREKQYNRLKELSNGKS